MYIKQPNGLYCKYSTISDMPISWNMTEKELKEDILQKKIQEAEEEYKNTMQYHIKSFEWMRDKFCSINITRKKFDKICKEMESLC